MVDRDVAVLCARDGEESVGVGGGWDAEAEGAEVECVDGEGVEDPGRFVMGRFSLYWKRGRELRFV
jgi:hypothetical protein